MAATSAPPKASWTKGWVWKLVVGMCWTVKIARGDLKDVEAHLHERKGAYLEQLKELIAIPSVSALENHREDVRDAARYVSDKMKDAGVEHVEVMETGGHPCVYGDWLHAPPGMPTVLLYAHFDVQPVDPLHLWKDQPFSGRVEGEKIFGRGAQDDKSGLLTLIQAFEAWMHVKKGLPVNVKFLLEGQEEIGSPNMPAFIQNQKDKLSADMAFSADGSQPSADVPGLYMGLRGATAAQIDVQTASRDVHSGSFGGLVQNPIHVLVHLLSSMFDTEGKVKVEGFYDDVLDIDDEVRQDLINIGYDAQQACAAVGAIAPFGDQAYTPLERIYLRPSFDILGIWGGFQGEGIKTIIPSSAHAKISSRIVPNQDPDRVYKALERHAQRFVPAAANVSIHQLSFKAIPYAGSKETPGNLAAKEILRELYGREPIFPRMGGSIPIVALFKQHLGIDTTTLAFGLDSQGVHAPNEFQPLSYFERSRLAYVRLFAKLADIASRHTEL